MGNAPWHTALVACHSQMDICRRNTHKNRKFYIPNAASNAVNPTENDIERLGSKPRRPNFRARKAASSPQIDGIDRGFLFGNLSPTRAPRFRWVGETTPLVVTPAGKQSLSPFEGTIHSHVRRESTTFGAVW